MDSECVADGLGWAEGPEVLPDGRVCCVDRDRRLMSVWGREAGATGYADTALATRVPHSEAGTFR